MTIASVMSFLGGFMSFTLTLEFLPVIILAGTTRDTTEKCFGWRTPLEVLTGETVDISILLYFLFWVVVCVSCYKEKSYM